MGRQNLLSACLLRCLLGTTGCHGGDDKLPDTGQDSDPVVDPGDDTGCVSMHRYFLDADDDGYGDTSAHEQACTAPAGYVDNNDDCDDSDDAINPGADDPCGDDIDANCDEQDSCDDLGAADFKLWATTRVADAGRHMDAGDIDGDGQTDLAIGEMWASNYEGGAFIAYGPVTESGKLVDEATEIEGGSGTYEGGRTVGVDDGDGDGYDDVLLGAPDATRSDVVLFFGPVADGLDFRDADVSAWCDVSIECGHGGDLSDIDGDGVADMIVGAGEERTAGRESGSVYLVFGPLVADSFDLRASHDVELWGTAANTESGRVLVSGGDLDGDGINDLLVTTGYDSTAGQDSGAVHVVLAPMDVDMSLDDADGKLLGPSAYAYAGEALAVGDLDGDGKADPIVGATGALGGDGAAYAVWGPATDTESLGDADLIVRGIDDESMGTAMAAHDLDGDGLAELMVGGANDDESGTGAGAAWLFAGPASGSLRPEDAERVFYGEARDDGAGAGLGFADMTGDGAFDALIGAPTESTGTTKAGAVYVVSLAGWAP